MSNKPRFTPEEMEIFIRCRRNALIKGMIFGSATCGLIYWLRAQGRGPSFVRSAPSVAYSLGFFFPFVYGGGSAPKCVREGILSLENSPLADRYREAMNNKRSGVGIITPPKRQDRPHVRKPSSHEESMQPKQPHFEPKSPEMKSGPSADSYAYNKEKVTLLEEMEKQLSGDEEQPNAFGGSSYSSSSPEVYRDQSSNGNKKGRTFDEIREERRRRGNSQDQPHRPTYPTDKPAASSEGTKAKKYNKYGDEIE